jgi:hypothetical protein
MRKFLSRTLLGLALAGGLAAPAAAVTIADLATPIPATWAGLSSGAANAQVLSAEGGDLMPGECLSFVPAMTNTGPMTLEISGHRGTVEKFTPLGLRQLAGGEIAAGHVTVVVWDGAEWALLEDRATTIRSLQK